MSENAIATIVVVTLAMLIPAIIIGLSYVLGRKKENETKSEVYESGLQATIGTAKERFSVKFYLVAIIFILFDVEAVFMFPWAVNFRELGWYGFGEMVMFIAILLAGYAYIIKKGALKWD